MKFEIIEYRDGFGIKINGQDLMRGAYKMRYTYLDLAKSELVSFILGDMKELERFVQYRINDIESILEAKRMCLGLKESVGGVRYARRNVKS